MTDREIFLLGLAAAAFFLGSSYAKNKASTTPDSTTATLLPGDATEWLLAKEWQW